MALYISLALYLGGLGAGLAGQPLAASALTVASTLATSHVLLTIYSVLEGVRRSLWGSVAALWIGAEYKAAIALFALGGVLYGLAGALLAVLPLPPLPRPGGELRLESVLAFGMIALGLLAALAMLLFALAYLVEVFTRDMYLLQVATGRIQEKPHSATFYVLLTLISLGLLFFYWLHVAWRRAQALKAYIDVPPGSHGVGS